MKSLLYLGALVAAIAAFFSGSLPYTLIYDPQSLQNVEHSGEEPLVAEVVECKIDDSKSMMSMATFETDFKAVLRNNTDRFVVVSTLGEVFDPNGSPLKSNSGLLVVSPNSVEETRFQLKAPFTTNGNYSCEMHYKVGRFR